MSRGLNFRDTEAIAWASGLGGLEAPELLRDSPWARTYRLSGESGRSYLKVLPDRQASVVSSTVQISRHFQRHVPPLIGHSDEAAALVTADHGGTLLDYTSSETEIRRLLTIYARIQAEAVGLTDLLSSVPRIDLATILPRFLDYLDPVSGDAGSGRETVGIAYFVGRSEADRYSRTMRDRVDLLERHLASADTLPETINHGDLRPPNAAVRSDGSLVLCDWDDAVAGPAGLSLHALFSGCATPAKILSADDRVRGAVSERLIARLEAYVSTLAAAGYADEPALRRALPATACAGVLQYLLNFGRYPRDDKSYRKAVRRSVSRRMSDLMDLCDFLAVQEGSARDHARSYARSGQHRRAQHLLQEHILDHPDDTAAHVALGDALRLRNRLSEAREAYRWASELSPEDPAPHARLGRSLLSELHFVEAIKALERAVALGPDLEPARADLNRARELRSMQATAAQPETVPRVAFSDDEQKEGRPRRETIALAAKLFETHGAVQMDNVFPVATIEALRAAFLSRYEPYFRKDDHPDALRVGDQRYMLTVDLEEPFDDPAIYASSLMTPLFRRLVGKDCVIGAYTSVISLPGSGDQRLHKDHPALFPSTEWHHSAPSFAVQMIVPLVSLDDQVGTTRIVKGSHRVESDRAAKMATQDPMVPMGSCLVNDYRVSHRGLGNKSDIVRPILTIIYNRPWFRDHANYSKQPPLRISDESYARLRDEYKHLFSWWKRPHTT